MKTTIKQLENEIKKLSKHHDEDVCAYKDYKGCFSFFESKAQLQTLKDVLKEIDNWSKKECIDEKEKCHECINELKAKLVGE